MTAQDVFKNSGIPLFKVRSSLHDLKSLGLVIGKNEQFLLHPNAKDRIKN